MATLVRDSDATGDQLTNVAVCLSGLGTGIGRLVTAGRNANGHLQLTVWQAKEDTSNLPASIITKKGSATGDAITDVAIQAVTDHQVLTAARNADGDLHLTTWSLSQDGQVTKQHEASAGAIGSLALVTTAANAGTAVTAVRTGGHLRLIAWKIDSGGAITRLGSADGNPAEHIAAVSTVFGVVTAARDSGGNLALASWRVDAAGQISHLDNAGAGAVNGLDIAVYTRETDPGFTNPRTIVVTAVHNGSGDLELITWSVSESVTGKITRQGSVTDAPATHIAVGKVGVAFEEDRILTADRDGNGKLAMQIWQTKNENADIISEDSAAGGTVEEIAIASYSARYLVTAVRTAAGNVKVISWRTN
jgi:hypothetical protein